MGGNCQFAIPPAISQHDEQTDQDRQVVFDPAAPMHSVFVRIGSMAEVHLARSPVQVQRGRRVLVRTDRGIELAEVAGPYLGKPASVPPEMDRRTTCIIRPTTSEDELLIGRLERHKREAIEACRRELAQSGSRAILLDVDQLLDGGTLLMHFMGSIDSIAESITSRIIDQYESIVRTRHFAKLLRDGCGPGCGTENEAGCGASCGGCSIASACRDSSQ